MGGLESVQLACFNGGWGLHAGRRSLVHGVALTVNRKGHLRSERGRTTVTPPPFREGAKPLPLTPEVYLFRWPRPNTRKEILATELILTNEDGEGAKDEAQAVLSSKGYKENYKNAAWGASVCCQYNYKVNA